MIFTYSFNFDLFETNLLLKKVNVYLPSLMMKVPDDVYVLG
jgi:hypothetical protein